MGGPAGSEPARRTIRQAWASTGSGTRLAALTTGYVLASSLMWAAITPIGGVPDEPAHIAYAAGVVRGDFGEPAPTGSPEFELLPHVRVPEWIRSIDTCFATAPRVTADCAAPPGDSRTLQPTGTTVIRYPPVYYWMVGWPSLVLSGSTAAYAMRALSAILAAGLIGLGLGLSSPSRRPWLALATAIAFTPMASHLVGSVNPNAMEIGAVLGLGAALIGIAESGQGLRSALIITTLVAAVAWSRPFRFLLVPGIVVLALVANWDGLRSWIRDRTTRLVVVIGSAVAIAGAAAFEVLFRSPVRDLYNDARVGAAAYDSDGLMEIVRDVGRLSDTWLLDLVGRFGWLDHVPPLAVRAGWLLVAVALVGLAVVAGTWRHRLAISMGVVGGLIVIPVATSIALFGSARWYQARYHLSVAALTLIIAGVAVAASDRRDVRRAGWMIARWGALLAAAGTLIAVASSMHRYSVGGQGHLSRLATFDFWTQADWLSQRTLTVAGLAAAALMAIATVIFFESRGAPPDRLEAVSD